jgi:palmitoyltransferase ZDHHC9/14/18
VGRRNYRYFFTFVASGALLGFCLLGASLAHILIWKNLEDTSFGEAVRHNRVPFAMVFYGLLSGMYPLSLLGYHLFLTGRGETTREYLQSYKFAVQDRHRPYTQGYALRNWAVTLLRPRPPTYLRFKSGFEEGDRRFGERRRQGVRREASKEGRGSGGLEMTSVGVRPAGTPVPGGA